MSSGQSVRRGVVSTLLAAALTTTGLATPVAAWAAPKPWNGRFQMTTYASRKAGTSPAARQPETDFGAVFALATACSFDTCVATVVDGPAPGNPTIPQPIRYTWNGTGWATTYDWLWDCLIGGGQQKQWAHATSFAQYAPQPDGSFRGTWHTDISEGACRGSVVMPVVAAPV